ncbi:TPA: hypothetical protein ACKRID_002369, partial [Proteus mirabilis]
QSERNRDPRPLGRGGCQEAGLSVERPFNMRSMISTKLANARATIMLSCSPILLSLTMVVGVPFTPPLVPVSIFCFMELYDIWIQHAGIKCDFVQFK